MLPRGYNRPTKRKLIPHLFSNILQVVAAADHPLTQPEIVEAVAERLERCDEELKRQITVGLNDALIYGYLRIKNQRYSVARVCDPLDPGPGTPKTSRPSSSGTQFVRQRLQRRLPRSVSDRMDPSTTSSDSNWESDDQRALGRRSSGVIVWPSGTEDSEEGVATPEEGVVESEPEAHEERLAVREAAEEDLAVPVAHEDGLTIPVAHEERVETAPVYISSHMLRSYESRRPSELE